MEVEIGDMVYTEDKGKGKVIDIFKSVETDEIIFKIIFFKDGLYEYLEKDEFSIGDE